MSWEEMLSRAQRVNSPKSLSELEIHARCVGAVHYLADRPLLPGDRGFWFAGGFKPGALKPLADKHMQMYRAKRYGNSEWKYSPRKKAWTKRKAVDTLKRYRKYLFRNVSLLHFSNRHAIILLRAGEQLKRYKGTEELLRDIISFVEGYKECLSEKTWQQVLSLKSSL